MSRNYEKEIGGEKVYRAWKDWGDEEFIAGKFVGETEDNYGKPNWSIQVEEYEIGDTDWLEENAFCEGSTICLNSNGSLDSKMSQVTPGTFVRIQYEGEDVLPADHKKYPNKKFHKVSVRVDQGSAPAAVNEPAAKKTNPLLDL